MAKSNSKVKEKNIKNGLPASVGLMSNAKWNKVFNLFLECEIPRNDVLVKLMNEKCPAKLADLYEGVPYLYIPYEIIEWIFIPAVIERERWNRQEKLSSMYFSVDLENIVKKLNALGQFEYERNGKGLTLYAYAALQA